MQDRTGKLPTPDSHVDNEYGTKTMVYNRKRDEKKGEEEKQRKKRRLKKYNSKKERKNSKPLIILLGHNRGCFLHFVHV